MCVALDRDFANCHVALIASPPLRVEIPYYLLVPRTIDGAGPLIISAFMAPRVKPPWAPEYAHA